MQDWSFVGLFADVRSWKWDGRSHDLCISKEHVAFNGVFAARMRKKMMIINHRSS